MSGKSLLSIPFALIVLSLQPVDAQHSPETEPVISKNEARKIVSAADKALNNAERAQRRGDTSGMAHALDDYRGHMNQVERGLDRGQVRPEDRDDVAEIVARATTKHSGKLEVLKGKVPEQAYQGINRALEVSQKGHDTALENLSRKKREELAREDRAERYRRRSEPSSVEWRGPDRSQRPGIRPGGSGRGPAQSQQGRGRGRP